ncbi:hypothetical protein [Clostridium sp. 'White wine YQ']|uniref:hypothetical protein n=1 Tax=Clostridium sp. 'White wine YQ' TaxID=3027474 RepID=UPI0023664E9C|nr:hypothetical protein [Clostridium sp. 'White wine YQ']MDD7794704.1 hypothetical protein [Clostridium sp. 'White wine YQ']
MSVLKIVPSKERTIMNGVVQFYLRKSLIGNFQNSSKIYKSVYSFELNDCENKGHLKNITLNFYLESLFNCENLDIGMTLVKKYRDNSLIKNELKKIVTQEDTRKYFKVDLRNVLGERELMLTEEIYLGVYSNSISGIAIFESKNSSNSPFILIEWEEKTEKIQGKNILESYKIVKEKNYEKNIDTKKDELESTYEDQVWDENLKIEETTEIEEMEKFEEELDISEIQEVHENDEVKENTPVEEYNIKQDEVEEKIEEFNDIKLLEEANKSESLDVTTKSQSSNKFKAIFIKNKVSNENISIYKELLKKLVGESIEVEVEDREVRIFKGIVNSINGDYVQLKRNEIFNVISIFYISKISGGEKLNQIRIENLYRNKTNKTNEGLNSVLSYLKDKNVSLILDESPMNIGKVQILDIYDGAVKVKKVNNCLHPKYYILNTHYIKVIENIALDEEYFNRNIEKVGLHG